MNDTRFLWRSIEHTKRINRPFLGIGQEESQKERLLDKRKLSSVIAVSQEISSIVAIEELLKNVVRRAIEITGVLLRFEKDRVEYVNAGHPDIYFKSNGVVSPVRKEDGEIISGMFLGMPSMVTPYEVWSFPIALWKPIPAPMGNTGGSVLKKHCFPLLPVLLRPL